MSYRYGYWADLIVGRLPIFELGAFETSYYSRVASFEAEGNKINITAEILPVFEEWNNIDEDISTAEYDNVIYDLLAISSLQDLGFISALEAVDYADKVIKVSKKEEAVKKAENVNELLTVSMGLAGEQSIKAEQFNQGITDAVVNTEPKAHVSVAYEKGFQVGKTMVEEELNKIESAANVSTEELLASINHEPPSPSEYDTMVDDLIQKVVKDARERIKWSKSVDATLRENAKLISAINDIADAAGIIDDNMVSKLIRLKIFVQEKKDSDDRIGKLIEQQESRLQDLIQGTSDFGGKLTSGIQEATKKLNAQISELTNENAELKARLTNFVEFDEYVLTYEKEGEWVYLGVDDKEHMMAAKNNSLKSSFYVKTKNLSKAIIFNSPIKAIDTLEKLRAKSKKLSFKGIKKFKVGQPSLKVMSH